MDIKPLLESLASLETACRDAVDCLNVLAENSGPEFGNLEKLQKLFGGHGAGGLQESIRQLCGIVGHCLNVDMPQQTYRLEVMMIKYQDVVDGTIVTTDELYVPGSKPYEINAANSIEALIYLLDESRASLNRAICKADGGGLIEWACAEMTGRPLVDDAWRRLNGNWDAVTKEVEIPKGLDLSRFHKLVSEEIKAAKHLLTFGKPLPTRNGAKAKTTRAPDGGRKNEATSKKKAPSGDEPKSYTQILAALCTHHQIDSPNKQKLTPVIQADLVRELGLGKATVSNFFKDHCEGFASYKRWCNDPAVLEGKLARLSLPKGTREKLRNLGGGDASIPAPELDEIDD